MTPDEADEVCQIVQDAITHAMAHIWIMARRGLHSNNREVWEALTPEEKAEAEADLQEWFQDNAGVSQ